MAGSYRMALARAKVTATAPDGQVTVYDEVTATVRDGKALARKFSQDLATMPATDLVRHTSRHFTITGPDGTVWDVAKPCNCGGG